MPLHVILVDDEPIQNVFWRNFFQKKYPDRVVVHGFENPNLALQQLDHNVDLVLLDWIMPSLNGADFLNAAKENGFDPKRIIIFSARSAKELHSEFELGDCLAVIEKGDPKQYEIIANILDEMLAQQKIAAKNRY